MAHALLFVYVWPEPRSSAAGVRTLGLAEDLLALGHEVTFLSPCKENLASSDLNRAGFATLPCPANETSVETLWQPLHPTLVVYDRFVMEEQFGWRARAVWPSALHIVDTQDLHTVRRAREKLARAGADAEAVVALQGADLSSDLERELASLYRADACFVVSEWEKDWLLTQGYPADRVCWLPFAAAADADTPGFEERRGFAFLGNFRHPPNLDAVERLRQEIWPRIHAQLPHEKLFLYGAYPPAPISALHGRNGIEVPGPVTDHRRALRQHRALLAPLRFGAGIKGKVLEAWATGTPVVGTSIALEGLGGEPLDQAESFCARAILLARDEIAWQKAQAEGSELVARFSPLLLREQLRNFLALAGAARAKWRAHPVGRMLRHHQQNATKYFSLWIEAKNRK